MRQWRVGIIVRGPSRVRPGPLPAAGTLEWPPGRDLFLLRIPHSAAPRG